PERERGDRRASGKAVPRKTKGKRQRERGADERGKRRELEAEDERLDPFGGERPLPPLRREAARRELRAVGSVARHGRGDADRPEHEDIDKDDNCAKCSPGTHRGKQMVTVTIFIALPAGHRAAPPRRQGSRRRRRGSPRALHRSTSRGAAS